MEKDDREGLGALIDELTRRRDQLLLVQGLDHAAARVDPFAHAPHPMLGDEGRTAHRLEAERVGHLHAAEFEQVLEAPSHDEADGGAVALHDRVHRDGRAVHQRDALVGREAGGREPERETFEHALLRCMRDRGGLRDGDGTVLVEHRRVRKGAADIDADPERHAPTLPAGSKPARPVMNVREAVLRRDERSCAMLTDAARRPSTS
jgi:hypothetical protein